jgi:hypothetical protein
MGIPTAILVESRMGAVAWGLMANAPFPIPAHRTGRAQLRHPALRLASPRDTREEPTARGVCAVGASPSSLDTAISDSACL